LAECSSRRRQHPNRQHHACGQRAQGRSDCIQDRSSPLATGRTNLGDGHPGAKSLIEDRTVGLIHCSSAVSSNVAPTIGHLLPQPVLCFFIRQIEWRNHFRRRTPAEMKCAAPRFSLNVPENGRLWARNLCFAMCDGGRIHLVVAQFDAAGTPVFQRGNCQRTVPRAIIL
jgi:hypothetical protein